MKQIFILSLMCFSTFLSANEPCLCKDCPCSIESECGCAVKKECDCSEVKHCR